MSFVQAWQALLGYPIFSSQILNVCRQMIRHSCINATSPQEVKRFRNHKNLKYEFSHIIPNETDPQEILPAQGK